MSNKNTSKPLVQSATYDFKPMRDEIRQFIIDNAQCVNVHALHPGRERDYPLADVMRNAITSNKESRVNELVELLVEALAQELVTAGLVEHFSSVPGEYENGLFKLGERLYIRSEPDKSGFEELNHDEIVEVLIEEHQPLSEMILEWIDDLIISMVERYFSHYNTWLTVDAKMVGNRITVTVGEDIRNVYFRKRRGSGRWRGKYILPDGTTIP